MKRRVRSCFTILIVGTLILYVLARIGVMIASPEPENLGIVFKAVDSSEADGLVHGELTQCPETPNCASSQTDGSWFSEPITFDDSAETAQANLLTVLENFPRTTMIKSEDGYIRVEFRTLGFGFIDDGEFLFDPENKVIHTRSAARLGQGDGGANHERLEEIRQLFNEQ